MFAFCFYFTYIYSDLQTIKKQRHEKHKLTRKSLDELAKIMPVLSEDEQRACIGGSGSTSPDPGLGTRFGNVAPLDGYGINMPSSGGIISRYSANLMCDVMESAGDYNISITSTIRTPYDQARIMYDNIVRTSVEEQQDIYKDPGDRVIGIYNPELSRAENIANMEAQIKSEGSSNVSSHCGDPSKVNTFDIAVSSLEDKAKFKATLEAYGITVLDENGCLHVVIPQ